jgi:hypothetical protein
VRTQAAVAQQPAPAQNPCEEKPISQRQMDDCAAFKYNQAEVHLNKVYRRAVGNGVSSRRHIGNTLRSARSEKPGFYLGSTLTITDVMSSFCGSSQVNRSAS